MEEVSGQEVDGKVLDIKGTTSVSACLVGSTSQCDCQYVTRVKTVSRKFIDSSPPSF